MFTLIQRSQILIRIFINVLIFSSCTIFHSDIKCPGEFSKNPGFQIKQKVYKSKYSGKSRSRFSAKNKKITYHSYRVATPVRNLRSPIIIPPLALNDDQFLFNEIQLAPVTIPLESDTGFQSEIFHPLHIPFLNGNNINHPFNLKITAKKIAGDSSGYQLKNIKQVRKARGFALVSFILSVLAFPLLAQMPAGTILALLAVITGGIAFGRYMKNPADKNKGLALIGIILGSFLLGLSVFVILDIIAFTF